jgi:hypothetical protein
MAYSVCLPFNRRFVFLKDNHLIVFLSNNHQVVSLLDNHQPSVSRRLFSKTTVNHQQYCMLIIVVPYRMTTIFYADKYHA